MGFKNVNVLQEVTLNFEQIVQKGNDYKRHLAGLDGQIEKLEAVVKKFKPDGNEISVNGLRVAFDRKEQQDMKVVICGKADKIKAERKIIAADFDAFQNSLTAKETKTKKDKE